MSSREQGELSPEEYDAQKRSSYEYYYKKGLEYFANEDKPRREPTHIREILRVLQSVPSAVGMFACQGVVPQDLVNIYSSGTSIGDLLLPLPLPNDSTLDPLLAAGILTRAPFGRGEDTVFDLKVRKTWQVTKESVQFRNPEFLFQVQTLAERAVRLMSSGPLGVKIVTHFHKLLVYGPGDFFKPHRDSVHSPLHFATLIIQLPSTYEGGTLKIAHGDEMMEVKQSGQESSFKPFFAAFYADCVHEVLPLTSGIRVCLAFDICYESRHPVLSRAPDTSKNSGTQMAEAAKKLENSLEAWYKWHQARKHSELSEPKCYCGQRLLYKGAKDPNPEDIATYPFRRMKSSDTSVIVLVLDHLLPRNELAMVMQAKSLEDVLWVLRGTDRVKVQLLLDAFKSLQTKDRSAMFSMHFAECSYSSKNGVCVTSALGDSVVFCSCMTKFLSSRSVKTIMEDVHEMGNDALTIDFKYEFVGVIIYPTCAKMDVFDALLEKKCSQAPAVMESPILSLEEKFDLVERLLETNKNARFHLGEKTKAQFSVGNLLKGCEGFADLVTPPHMIDETGSPSPGCWCTKPLVGLDSRAMKTFRLLRHFFSAMLKTDDFITAMKSGLWPLKEVLSVLHGVRCYHFNRRRTESRTIVNNTVSCLVLLEDPSSPFMSKLRNGDLTLRLACCLCRSVFKDARDHLLDIKVDLAKRFIPQFEKWLKEDDQYPWITSMERVETPYTAALIIETFTTPGHPHFQIGVQCAEILSRCHALSLKQVIEQRFPMEATAFKPSTIVFRGVVEAYCTSRTEQLKSSRHVFRFKVPKQFYDFLVADKRQCDMSLEVFKRLNIKELEQELNVRFTENTQSCPPCVNVYRNSCVPDLNVEKEYLIREEEYLKRLTGDEIEWN